MFTVSNSNIHRLEQLPDTGLKQAGCHLLADHEVVRHRIAAGACVDNPCVQHQNVHRSKFVPRPFWPVLLALSGLRV